MVNKLHESYNLWVFLCFTYIFNKISLKRHIVYTTLHFSCDNLQIIQENENYYRNELNFNY